MRRTQRERVTMPSVLVVEDESDVRRLIAVVLQRAGFDVVDVADRGQAEAALSLQAFDAAVVDLCLPDGRGDQLVALLRERSPETRVVITSAFAHSSLALHAAAQTGDVFLHKPFSNAGLVSAVSAINSDR